MISGWLNNLEKELEQNSPKRHEEPLETLASWIAKQNKNGKKARLNFICTHNSRRSQFAQVWCSMVQSYLGLDMAESYSGGTEVTACNPRAIEALRRTGLEVEHKKSNNPVYTVRDNPNSAVVQLWSKVYDDKNNPGGEFAAVMTCDHADANCPFIPGAAIRVPLTYKDPKYADDTPEEKGAYDHTCKLIASDMLRLFKLAKSKS